MATTSPTYILGLNCNIHQSAAVLVKDGQMVAAVEEERFTRKKFDSAFPAHAIAYCLSEAGITMRDVTHVGFYWQPWKGLVTRVWWLVRYFPASLETFRGAKQGRGSVWTLFDHFAVPLKVWRMGFRGRFYFVDHHLAHAASAFYVSPFERAAVATVDFTGEHCTTLLGHGVGNRIEVKRRFFLPHSVGLFYGALTQFLGYKIHADEYRVMGLAPYGEPKYVDTFRSMMSFVKGVLRVDNSWFAFHLGGEKVYSDKWNKEFGEPCRGEDYVEEGEYKHYAASGQRALEEVYLAIARWLKEETKEDAVCLAGGVALNSSANGKLKAAGVFKDVWVQPAAYDPGCALGVCFYIWHTKLGKERSYTMTHAYWGPSYDDAAIEAAIEKYDLVGERVADVAHRAADLLAEGKVIGWYQGRMEWGPRSLGNRSILADPRREDTKELVNEKIKFREPYRPFAPAVIQERTKEFFDIDQESPYMTIVCPVHDEKKKVIPAVTHIDGSARIQTVAKDANPKFWELINAFGEKTGVPVVLNTSFNVKGEPVVCTPEDAVKCFLNTNMDYVVLGDFLCHRQK